MTYCATIQISYYSYVPKEVYPCPELYKYTATYLPNVLNGANTYIVQTLGNNKYKIIKFNVNESH